MSDQRARLGAANLSLPLMIVSFLLIAGFLWWLSVTAESVEVTVDEGAAVEEPAGGMATDVTVDELRLEPERFEGQVVRISRVDVAAAVGQQAFFLDLPQTPFLVKMDEALVRQGRTVPTGQVTVTGPVRVMTDSIVQDWVGRNLIPESDALLVEFATHFIEARSVETAATPPGGDGQEG